MAGAGCTESACYVLWGVYCPLMLFWDRELNAHLQMQFFMGHLLEVAFQLSLVARDLCHTRWSQSMMGASCTCIMHSKENGSLEECTAPPNWNIIIDAPKADFLTQQGLKKSTYIHIIIMCHFQCKISWLLLTNIQHTWCHSPSKQTWPSHTHIADYNICNKIKPTQLLL